MSNPAIAAQITILVLPVLLSVFSILINYCKYLIVYSTVFNSYFVLGHHEKLLLYSLYSIINTHDHLHVFLNREILLNLLVNLVHHKS